MGGSSSKAARATARDKEVTLTDTGHLVLPMERECKMGALKLRLTYDAERSQLIVRAKEGRDLIAADSNGSSDPFLAVWIKGEEANKMKTNVVYHNLNPIWDQQLAFKVIDRTKHGLALVIQCWDKDKLSHNDYMGGCTIPVSLIPQGPEASTTGYHGWFELLPKGHDDNHVNLGDNWLPICEREFAPCLLFQQLEAEEDPDAAYLDGIHHATVEEGDHPPPVPNAKLDKHLKASGASRTSFSNDDAKKERKSVITVAAEKTANLGKNVVKGVLTPWNIPKMLQPMEDERTMVLVEAKKLGDARRAKCEKPRHITILYNPVSGDGTAKKIVDHLVAPVFRAAHVEFDAIPTQYQGYAEEYVRDMDLEFTDGICIAGGDGLVHEVVTGYMTRPGNDRTVPLGIIPSGTANAMAHYVHSKQSDHSQTSVCMRAALAAATGETRPLDAMEVLAGQNGEQKVYALSVLGWGLAGAVALQAAKMRWIPGQKKFRYDLAGFVTMVSHWPVVSHAKMSFLLDKEDGTEDWLEETSKCINLLVTNLPELGMDHPIYEDVKPDDGRFAVVIIDGKASRRAVVSAAMHMKKGKYMASHPTCRSFHVRELKIEPLPGMKTPFNVDGDPLDCNPLHIKCLHGEDGVRVFSLPQFEAKEFIAEQKRLARERKEQEKIAAAERRRASKPPSRSQKKAMKRQSQLDAAQAILDEREARLAAIREAEQATRAAEEAEEAREEARKAALLQNAREELARKKKEEADRLAEEEANRPMSMQERRASLRKSISQSDHKDAQELDRLLKRAQSQTSVGSKAPPASGNGDDAPTNTRKASTTSTGGNRASSAGVARKASTTSGTGEKAPSRKASTSSGRESGAKKRPSSARKSSASK